MASASRAPRDLVPRWLLDHHQQPTSDDERALLRPPPHLRMLDWDDGFTPSGCNNRPGKIIVDQPRSTTNVCQVIDGAVRTQTADLIYASAVRAKVWGVFVPTSQLTVSPTSSAPRDEVLARLRTQLHTQSANESRMEPADATTYRQGLARLAIEEFLIDQAGSIINAADWSTTYGVAVWVIASDCDDETEYHMDYAEMLRYETNVIFPPIYGATLHVSPLRSSDHESPNVDLGVVEGGGFHVNTRGRAHYDEYGYKTRRRNKMTTDALEAITTTEDGWRSVPYLYCRGIVCDGEFPHFSGRVRALPTTPAEQPWRRVVVGFNLFPHEIGHLAERFPEHSGAFNRYIKLSQTAVKQTNTNERWSLESIKKNPKQAAFIKFLARKMKEKQQLDAINSPQVA